MKKMKVTLHVLLVVGSMLTMACWLTRCLFGEAAADLTCIKTDVDVLDAEAGTVSAVASGQHRAMRKGDGTTVDDAGRARLDMQGCILEIFRDTDLNIKGLPSGSAQACIVDFEHGTIYHRVEKKMIVSTDWAVITSLGTEFFVHLDLERGLLWLVVTDGVVQVEAAGEVVYVREAEQSWVRRGQPPQPPRPATRSRVGDLFPLVDELTGDEMGDPSVLVEEPETDLSLSLRQSTDEVFAGACGEPQTVKIVAELEGSSEALKEVRSALLTHWWEGSDEHSTRMEREADDLFFAVMGPFDTCCEETPLAYTVTLFDANGAAMATGGGEVSLTYCEEAYPPGPDGLPRIDGASLLVLGPYTGGEQEARLGAVNERFTELTGIKVVYEGTKSFETMISTRLEAGQPPDVGLLAQPDLMWRFAEAGQLVSLPSEIIDRIGKNYASAWLELGSYQGEPYGVFHRVYPRSFVWYPRRSFEEMGYEVPGTWDDLITLSKQIVADGGTPWCIGIESGAASGWVATDWLEDVVLRTAGPEVYDAWWQHEIPFDDKRIVEAGRYVEEIWFNDAYVFGGREDILERNYADVSLPMWDDPPGCYLYRQGNFIIARWPEEIQGQLDRHVGVFGLPPIDRRYGIPLLVSGDQFVMFDDRPEVRAYLTYLTMGTSTEPMARAGGALFPHRDQDLDAYPTEVERTMGRLVMKASVVRFDASDLMPAEVGAGTFWEGMVNWVEGAPLERILISIDATWP